MASHSQVTKKRRATRHDNAGRKAKRLRENLGTTPPFAIHTPEADANAEAKAAEKARPAETTKTARKPKAPKPA